MGSVIFSWWSLWKRNKNIWRNVYTMHTWNFGDTTLTKTVAQVHGVIFHTVIFLFVCISHSTSHVFNNHFMTKIFEIRCDFGKYGKCNFSWSLWMKMQQTSFEEMSRPCIYWTLDARPWQRQWQWRVWCVFCIIFLFLYWSNNHFRTKIFEKGSFKEAWEVWMIPLWMKSNKNIWRHV